MCSYIWISWKCLSVLKIVKYSGKILSEYHETFEVYYQLDGHSLLGTRYNYWQAHFSKVRVSFCYYGLKRWPVINKKLESIKRPWNPIHDDSRRTTHYLFSEWNLLQSLQEEPIQYILRYLLLLMNQWNN